MDGTCQHGFPEAGCWECNAAFLLSKSVGKTVGRSMADLGVEVARIGIELSALSSMLSSKGYAFRETGNHAMGIELDHFASGVMQLADDLRQAMNEISAIYVSGAEQASANMVRAALVTSAFVVGKVE